MDSTGTRPARANKQTVTARLVVGLLIRAARLRQERGMTAEQADQEIWWALPPRIRAEFERGLSQRVLDKLRDLSDEADAVLEIEL
jgi:hypothetical protein